MQGKSMFFFYFLYSNSFKSPAHHLRPSHDDTTPQTSRQRVTLQEGPRPRHSRPAAGDKGPCLTSKKIVPFSSEAIVCHVLSGISAANTGPFAESTARSVTVPESSKNR